MLGNFSCFFVSSWYFSKLLFSKILTGIYHQSVKQVEARSGQTFCQSWSEFKLFAKVISSLQKFSLSRWRVNHFCRHHWGLNLFNRYWFLPARLSGYIIFEIFWFGVFDYITDSFQRTSLYNQALIRLAGFHLLACIRPLVNWVHTKRLFFFISQPKHMLWVLKRTFSNRRFFWAPKTYAKNYG